MTLSPQLLSGVAHTTAGGSHKFINASGDAPHRLAEYVYVYVERGPNVADSTCANSM